MLRPKCHVMFPSPFLGFNMKVVALALTLLLALGESGLAHFPSSVVCVFFLCRSSSQDVYLRFSPPSAFCPTTAYSFPTK